MESKKGRKRAAIKAKEEVEVDESPEEEQEEEVKAKRKTAPTKKAVAKNTGSKKQKVDTETKQPTYDIIERLLMEEKARDYDVFSDTVEKLKKMFNRECGNVDAYKCGKEFLKKSGP